MERELSFLLALGFVFDGVAERASNVLGAYLEGSYTNWTADRIVRVVYLPKHEGPRALVITRIELIVSQAPDEFDYTSIGSMEVCVTDLSASEDDLVAGFERHLLHSEQVLKEKFPSVLRGAAWESDQLDWGGMK
jgi:hypothetical protein